MSLRVYVDKGTGSVSRYGLKVVTLKHYKYQFKFLKLLTEIQRLTPNHVIEVVEDDGSTSYIRAFQVVLDRRAIDTINPYPP